MIRPLRRRHRWMIPTLFLLLVLAAVAAETHRAPSARIEQLPSQLIEAAGTERAR